MVMKKSRPKAAKPKAKPKSSPPALTGGRKRDTRFQPGNSAGADTQFKPGISGNPAGRHIGARSRFTDAFFEEVLASWQNHGKAAIEWVATNDRALFVQVCAALVPRNIKAELEVQKPIYVMSGRPIGSEEWAAKYADPVK